MDVPDIVVQHDERVSPQVLKELVARFFEDMVKFVVDIEKEIAAVGGELHADAEAILLEEGCRQEDLWGANYYPGMGGEECIEYTSLINIRPSQGNRSMLIEDAGIRARVRDIALRLIGTGDALS